MSDPIKTEQKPQVGIKIENTKPDTSQDENVTTNNGEEEDGVEYPEYSEPVRVTTTSGTMTINPENHSAGVATISKDTYMIPFSDRAE